MAGVEGSRRQHGGKQAESQCSVEMLGNNLEVQFVLTCRGGNFQLNHNNNNNMHIMHHFQTTFLKEGFGKVLIPSVQLAAGCCSRLWLAGEA